MRYSLAKYILTISTNDSRIRDIFKELTFGGEGALVGSVTFSRQNNMWDTSGYATGGYVHSKNLSKIGTVTLSVNQLATNVGKLIAASEAFFGGDYDGFTLTLTTNEGQKVASAIDCYIQKTPDQGFESQAQNQTWTFTCGEINFSS